MRRRMLWSSNLDCIINCLSELMVSSSSVSHIRLVCSFKFDSIKLNSNVGNKRRNEREQEYQ